MSGAVFRGVSRRCALAELAQALAEKAPEHVAGMDQLRLACPIAAGLVAFTTAKFIQVIAVNDGDTPDAEACRLQATS
ncbi:hypothetical protein KUL25_20285 [Rhodobacteraceae bacterium N5(2021)]|uniref:Uncharacterized protein n=1 Tax=Gymnodinialimonas phycosphaerae TaxID=2841589 RepID=A0ABS7MYA8_9RHOB|nr:hypothetical protein [Gymnodinialimonas phycosphaerae]MBY4895106.1 hypothetical protein [Gymnodinialimonas phycosphaerae]